MDPVLLGKSAFSLTEKLLAHISEGFRLRRGMVWFSLSHKTSPF